MELYIVRHGIAIDREDPKSPAEAERYLTEEGVTKTKQVAKALAAQGLEADLFISSPYVRAVQTADIFANAFKYSKAKIVKTDSLLPGAEPGAFFRELTHQKQASRVFCFGHAPNVDELIAAALGVNRQITSLKKAGVALLELKRILPPSGQLIWLATPKLVRKSGR